MIIDKLLEFADGQTVTGGTTTVSTNTVDIGTLDRAIGSGRQLYAHVVVVGISGGASGSDTVRFDLVQSANADLSSDTIIASSRTVTTGAGPTGIAVGDRFVIPVPPSFLVAGRYLGIAYDAITADLVLTVDAYLTDDPGPDHRAYPDAI